jgi:hypothetical protein
MKIKAKNGLGRTFLAKGRIKDRVLPDKSHSFK